MTTKLAFNQINGNVVSVKDFGAVGDGVTDDTAAIQAAINASGRLRCGEGNFLITQPLLGVDGLYIEGDGHDKTIFTYTYEQQVGDDEIYEVKASGSSPGGGSVSMLTTLDGHNDITIKGLKAVYTGTFDTGSSYSGKIAAFRIGQCDNLLIEGCEITGFNHSGIYIQPHTTYGAGVDNVSLKHVIRDNYLHTNRASGCWYTHVNGISFIGNHCKENGLSTDIGTGYGIASSGYGGTDQPRNVYVENNWFDNNKYTGCDFHRGNKSINVTDNRFTADTSESAEFGQIRHLYVLNTQGGAIKVTNNDFQTLRKRTTSTFSLTTCIDIRYELASFSDLTPLSVLISGNTFRDINVDGAGTQDAQIITFSNQKHPSLYATIANNHFEVTETDYFVFGGSPAVVGTYEFGQLTIENNIFNADTVNADPVTFGNLSNATISNNVMNVTTCNISPFTSAYVLNPASGNSLNGLITATGNTTEINNRANRSTINAWAQASNNNIYNGAREIDKSFTVVSGTYYNVTHEHTLGTRSVGPLVDVGSTVTYTNASGGSAPGAYCTQQYNRTLASQSLSGTNTLTLTATCANAQNGDPISVELDNGNRHVTTIASGATTTTITLTDNLPDDTLVDNLTVYICVWKDLATISA